MKTEEDGARSEEPMNSEPRPFSDAASEGETELPVSPLLIDIASIASQLFVLVVGSIVLAVSLYAGVDFWLAALRTGAAVFILGLLLWLLNWFLTKQIIELVITVLKERAKQSAEHSTVERLA